MGIFSKNKENKYDPLSRIGEFHMRIIELEKKLEHLEQLFKQLRGLVNRKLGYESESPESPQSKDIYSGMLLPE